MFTFSKLAAVTQRPDRSISLWCFCIPLLIAVVCVGCTPGNERSEGGVSLSEARSGFLTDLLPQTREGIPAPMAPPSIFRTVQYPAPSGELTAYLSPDPGDGKRHPAIIWITGGDSNSIGDVWTPEPRKNDQTAAAIREAGVLMMFPSLRGGNDNPGVKESFLGEVDDVLAAATHLAKQQYVDPERIYLGGHSTGGTLVLLVAEYSDRFRGVFSFGPVEDVTAYGADSGLLPFDISNRREVELRSPYYWLASVQSPVWIIEGTKGNIDALRTMDQVTTNPKIHFIEVDGADHFSVLAPTNELLANKILEDSAATSQLSISEDEINRNFVR